MTDGDREPQRAQRDEQHRDQDEFSEDPRGGQEVAGQQPETQPAGEGDGSGGGDSSDDDHGEQGDRGQVGRDDPGQATGDPQAAG